MKGGLIGRDEWSVHTEYTGAYYFHFPFILEHREDLNGRPDCVLCKKCFRDHNYSYPDELVSKDDDLVRTHEPLEHLSKKSIKYIMPKEKFSEDIIIQFTKAGVYRATFFVGMKGDADCSCATKQFYIAEDVPNRETASEKDTISTQSK